MNKSKCVRAFTLIEMLVVIAVILILAGIVLKTTGLIFRNALKAKAKHDLEQLQNALNEYYKEYGSYPPVNFLDYEYEGTNTREPLGDYLTLPAYNTPGLPTFIRDISEMERPGWPESDFKGDLKFRYGLVAYLWPRDKGQVHWYDKDTDRDTRAKAKWAGYLKDVGLSGGGAAHTIMFHGGINYSNDTQTINDPWNNPYHYESKPPYQSYTLSSDGPSGLPSDDLNADSSLVE